MQLWFSKAGASLICDNGPTFWETGAMTYFAIDRHVRPVRNLAYESHDLMNSWEGNELATSVAQPQRLRDPFLSRF